MAESIKKALTYLVGYFEGMTPIETIEHEGRKKIAGIRRNKIKCFLSTKFFAASR